MSLLCMTLIDTFPDLKYFKLVCTIVYGNFFK